MSATAVQETPLVAAEEEDLPIPAHLRGARSVLKQGLRESPALRKGLAFTVVISLAATTADVDTLSKFTEWGGVAWIVSFAMILGSLLLMLAYSWQLTVPVVLMVVPMLVIVARMQGSLSAAYDAVRARVGEMLSEVSESVMGAAVVRAYGMEEQVDRRVKRSIRQRYDAQVLAHLRTARMFPMATIFWGLSLSVVIFTGATFGPEWGLTFGKVSAFLFLADVFVHTFTDLPEIYADTQTAISGWRKILALLEIPVEITEPSPGVGLPPGPLEVHAAGVSYRYGDGPLVVQDVSLEVPAGAHVAVVGETGSGKTTFCKLLTRLADPVLGRIEVEGVDLREI